MPRSLPARLIHAGATLVQGAELPLTSPATRSWRRWTRSASTERSTSRRFRCTAIDGSYAVEVQHARLEEVCPISRHARPQLRFLALLTVSIRGTEPPAG